MRESRPYGSVRGALSNERPYRDVRRETGEEHEVKVLYGEGFAHRTGPEPCAVDREVGGEASAGGGIGQPLSRERFVIPGADGVPRLEGDADRRKTARTVPARRGQRPWHVLKLLAREPGDLLPIRGARASPDRVGKARSRSRR